MQPPIPLQVSNTVTIGGIYLLTSAALLVLVRQPIRHLDKPGSKGFLIAILSVSLWPLSTGVNLFVADRTLSIAIWNWRLLAASAVSVGWFLLAYEFRSNRLPGRALLATLACYVFGTQLLAWTNGLHHLVLAAGTTVEHGVLLPAYGPWFWVQSAVNYCLILAATGLLVSDWLDARGLRRQQSALLAVAVIPPIVANLLTLFELVDTVYDLTPFGLIGTAVLLSWTLFRLEFLNVVPVGRSHAVQVMDDPVVTVDDDFRVLDCNEAAQRQFAVDDDFYGLSLEEALDSLPEDVLTGLREPADAAGTDEQTDLTVVIDGRERHFSLTRSTVTGPGGTDLGQVLVFRDVTALKRRETELELLQQILSRILRHNLRNELTVISGRAAQLAEAYDDERIEEIQMASESVSTSIEKTRHLKQMARPDAPAVKYDLEIVVAEAIASVCEEFPAATVRTDLDGARPVRVSEGLPLVIENLLENAIEHSDEAAPTVEVTVTATTDGQVLAVSDDGPGIDDGELAVLEARRETQLDHGSGIGLWLVTWWADRSVPSLSFDTGAAGTTVSLTFPAATLVDD